MKRIGLIAALILGFSVAAFAAPGDTPKVTVKDTKVMLLPGMPAATFHTVTLTWVASTTAAICLPTNTPPCTNFGYNVLAGSAAGQESSTPLNSSLISALTFTDTTLAVSTTTTSRFYVVEAQDTLGSAVNLSGPSNEVSVTFPGLQPPSGVAVSSAQ